MKLDEAVVYLTPIYKSCKFDEYKIALGLVLEASQNKCIIKNLRKMLSDFIGFQEDCADEVFLKMIKEMVRVVTEDYDYNAFVKRVKL